MTRPRPSSRRKDARPLAPPSRPAPQASPVEPSRRTIPLPPSPRRPGRGLGRVGLGGRGVGDDDDIGRKSAGAPLQVRRALHRGVMLLHGGIGAGFLGGRGAVHWRSNCPLDRGPGRVDGPLRPVGPVRDARSSRAEFAPTDRPDGPPGDDRPCPGPGLVAVARPVPPAGPPPRPARSPRRPPGSLDARLNLVRGDHTRPEPGRGVAEPRRRPIERR